METEITFVTSWRETNELREALAKTPLVALDIEANHVDVHAPDFRILCVAFSTREGHAYVVPVDHVEGPGREVLHDLFSSIAQPIWLMQGGDFDYMALKAYHIELRTPWEDTMVGQYLLDVEAPKGLESLVQRWLELPPWKDIDYKNPADEPLDVLARLCGRDADATLRVWHRMSHEIYSEEALSRLYTNLMQPAVVALCDMQERGVVVDEDYLLRLIERTEDEVNRLVEAIREIAGDPQLNPNSTIQLRKVLFGQLGLPVVEFTPKGAPSTNASSLTRLRNEHAIIPLLEEYREAYKLLTASLRPWYEEADGGSRLHPRYKPAFVKTGRLSSERPNIQQVPRRAEVRRVFTAPVGEEVLEVDYSQLELRIVSWIAGERVMLDAYRDGADLHTVTAERLGVPRQTGKTANFGLLYGAGHRKLQQIARDDYGVILTEGAAAAIRADWFAAYPAIEHYHHASVDAARTAGGARTPFGRFRRLDDLRSPNHAVRAHAERQAINTPVQSTASDITLLMVAELNDDPILKDLGVRPAITVHDSILFYGNIDEGVMSHIRDRMENPPLEETFGVSLGVPLVVDMKRGPSWGEAEEV